MKSVLFVSFILVLFLSCNQSEISSDSIVSQNTILIDVSHGGKDPGAIAKDGLKEKDLSLNYASYIESELKKENVVIWHTRTKDEFISLFDRVQKAESQNVDVVISIHFNISTDPLERGIKTYFKPECTQSTYLDSRFHSKVSISDLIKDNGGEPGIFYVIKNSPVPTILIDVGYLSNKEDVTLITDEEFKVKFAKVLSETLIEYLQI